MMKKKSKPEAVYDGELLAKGMKRVLVAQYNDLGQVVYRERVVPITSEAVKPFFKMKKGRARMNADNNQMTEVEGVVGDIVRQRLAKATPKAPRQATKLAQAIDVVKATGKDDKESCLQAIVSALAVTRGNASIYYAKAKAILG